MSLILEKIGHILYLIIFGPFILLIAIVAAFKKDGGV